MREPEPHNLLFDFGIQMDTAIMKRHDYGKKPNDISMLWPELKGHEAGILRALDYVAVERLQLLTMYGLKDDAVEITRARLDIIQDMNRHEIVAAIIKGFDIVDPSC